MATHYKGERIEELLDQIAQLQMILDENQVWNTEQELVAYSRGYATLVWNKAKLKALQGED
jgi:uncharacterized membrane protein affecting hemolysin expression